MSYLYNGIDISNFLMNIPGQNFTDSNFQINGTGIAYYPNVNDTQIDSLNISRASYGSSVTMPYSNIFSNYSPKVYVYRPTTTPVTSGATITNTSHTHTLNSNTVRWCAIVIGGGGGGMVEKQE